MCDDEKVCRNAGQPICEELKQARANNGILCSRFCPCQELKILRNLKEHLTGRTCLTKENDDEDLNALVGVLATVVVGTDNVLFGANAHSTSIEHERGSEAHKEKLQTMVRNTCKTSILIGGQCMQVKDLNEHIDRMDDKYNVVSEHRDYLQKELSKATAESSQLRKQTERLEGVKEILQGHIREHAALLGKKSDECERLTILVNRKPDHLLEEKTIR
jgi:hypothetical protein